MNLLLLLRHIWLQWASCRLSVLAIREGSVRWSSSNAVSPVTVEVSPANSLRLPKKHALKTISKCVEDLTATF